MSTFNKVKWIVFLLLVGCITALTVIDFARNDTLQVFTGKNEVHGLTCVYNCEYFDEVTQ